MPSSTAVRQVLTRGTPLTVITQSLQWPMPQNTPLGSPLFRVCRKTRMPSAVSAAATVSPSRAVTGSPL